MTSVPACVQTPNTTGVLLDTANTNRDGTGTLSSAITVGANGCLLSKVFFQAITTTAPGTLRLFISNDGGTTKTMLGEATSEGATISATGAAEQVPLELLYPLELTASAKLYGALNNSGEKWYMYCCRGDL